MSWAVETCFFVVPSGMCWRGLGPSHTKSMKLPTFHIPSFLIPLVRGRLKGWQGTFALLSFAAPPPQCKKPFSSKSLSSREKIICKLLHHLCSLIASLISLICKSLLIDEGQYWCSLHVTLKVWFTARVSCSSFNMSWQTLGVLTSGGGGMACCAVLERASSL